MGGAPRGHAAPPRLRAVARERARPATVWSASPACSRSTAVRTWSSPTRWCRRRGARGYATEAGAAALELRLRGGRARARRRHREARRTAPRSRVLAQARAARARRRPSTGASAGRSTSWPPPTGGRSGRRPRPPLLTERLELRRFAAADLEPLLDVFGDPEVMRYVGAERRPLDRRRRSQALHAQRRGALGRPRVRARWPSSSGRPGAWSGRPACSSWRPARTSSSGTRSRAPPGVAATRPRRRAPSCAGRSPACACTASWPSPTPPTRASLRVLEKLGMTRAGPARLLRGAHGRVRALAGEWRAWPARRRRPADPRRRRPAGGPRRARASILAG